MGVLVVGALVHGIDRAQPVWLPPIHDFLSTVLIRSRDTRSAVALDQRNDHHRCVDHLLGTVHPCRPSSLTAPGSCVLSVDLEPSSARSPQPRPGARSSSRSRSAVRWRMGIGSPLSAATRTRAGCCRQRHGAIDPPRPGNATSTTSTPPTAWSSSRPSDGRLPRAPSTTCRRCDPHPGIAQSFTSIRGTPSSRQGQQRANEAE